MKPAAFAYERPSSVDEALTILEQAPGAKILAGGQSLVPLMNFRLSRPEVLVDINGLGAELNDSTVHGDGVRIGALVRHQQLITEHPLQILAEAAEAIGHWAIRNRGTLGGSLAHADPAAELPAVLEALNGSVVVRSRQGERRIGARDFFQGYFTTTLEPNELIVAAEFQRPQGQMGFYEVVRRPGDFALVGALTHQWEKQVDITWFGLGAKPVKVHHDDWPLDPPKQESELEELLSQVALEANESYKRAIGVSVALRALSLAKEGK